jgi:cyclopropane fatty-acyl-phospholipid synthase-like methyltransferase
MSEIWKKIFHRPRKEGAMQDIRVEESAASMKGVNSYWCKSQFEDPRSMVGGMWEEIGQLQFDFLRSQGLHPDNTMIDIGCGCLRGGVHFVRFLRSGHYCGIDINESLVEAGRRELELAGIADREVRLRVTDSFDMTEFGEKFDFGLGVSLFTHLFANHIIRCLVQARKVMKPTSRFYFSFFQAPHSAHLSEYNQDPGGIVTKFDSDPFHYSVEEMDWFAREAGLRMTLIGNWGHPRGQQMLCFTLP